MSVLPDAPARSSAWPEPLPPVLSPTQVNTILTCPEQYRRVYLQGEYSRPSGALVIGSADSDAAEHNFRQKIESHEDLPVAEVEDAASDSFRRRVEEDDVDWEGSSPGEALDTTIRVVRAYHHAYAPTVQPVLVEETVELAVEGAPLVRARVDVTTDSRVISRKTSARKVSAAKPGWLNQSAIESAATGLPTDWHVTTKAKTPEVLGLPWPGGDPAVRAARVVQGAVDLVLTLMERHGPDEVWPGNFSTFAPPCGYCALRETCWWHGG